MKKEEGLPEGWVVTQELVGDQLKWVGRFPQTRAVQSKTKRGLLKIIERGPHSHSLGRFSDKRRTLQAGGEFYNGFVEPECLMFTAPFVVKTEEDAERARAAFAAWEKTHFARYEEPPQYRAKRKREARHPQRDRKLYFNLNLVDGVYVGEGGGIRWKIRQHGKRKWVGFPIESSIPGDNGIGNKEVALRYYQQQLVEGNSLWEVALRLKELHIP